MIKRLDYTKESMSTPAIYFDDRPMNAIQFREVRKVNLEGIKKDQYEVDNFGNAYSNGKMISPALINSGYLKYALVTGEKDPKYKNILTHQLFQMVFDPIDNPQDFTVNHISMNRFDNSSENLEWVLQSENNKKKSDVFPNSGVNNYKSMFNYSQLETIVEGIDNDILYKTILEVIGVEPSDNNCDSIGNIKRGLTYKKKVNEIRQR